MTASTPTARQRVAAFFAPASGAIRAIGSALQLVWRPFRIALRWLGRWIVIIAYTPFAEMVIWVGTLFGGIVFSNAKGDGFLMLTGLLIVTLAVSPLGVRGTIEWRARRRDESLDGREATAAEFGAAVLEDAADFELTGRTDRVSMSEEGINEALDHIWRKYFSSHREVRVLLYEISDDKTELVPSTRFEPRGRQTEAEARPFIAGESERSDLGLALLDAVEPYWYVSDVSTMTDAETGGPHSRYEAFFSVPIRATSEAFGMLTVDSSKKSLLSKRDGEPLQTYANAIAFYLAAERRGRQNRRQDGGREDDSEQHSALGGDDPSAQGASSSAPVSDGGTADQGDPR